LRVNNNQMICYNWLGRLVLSIILGAAWLVFLILWLFFYATTYNIYQNIAIILVSFIIEGTLQAITWIPWNMKQEIKSN